METIKIIDQKGLEIDVFSIFYAFNGIYYLIYTDKSLDESGYVILHIVKVGKNLINDVVEFVGVEVEEDNEWKSVQKSISIIVEDKKNETTSQEIQYLPSNMLNTPIRIIGDKTFRLKRDIVENSFGLSVETEIITGDEKNNSNIETDDNVIIDYRTKFFEEQEKNEELKKEIMELQKKLQQINEIIKIEDDKKE